MRVYADDVLTFVLFVDPATAVFISLKINFTYFCSYKVAQQWQLHFMDCVGKHNLVCTFVKFVNAVGANMTLTVLFFSKLY